MPELDLNAEGNCNCGTNHYCETCFSPQERLTTHSYAVFTLDNIERFKNYIAPCTRCGGPLGIYNVVWEHST